MTEIIGKVKTHTSAYKSRCYLCAGVIDALAPHTLTYLEAIDRDDDGAYERPCQDLVYIHLDTLQDPRALLERVEDEHHRAWLLARYERLVALASGQMNLF